MEQAIEKFAKISVVSILIFPPLMVLYLEGPVWPAIQFLIIQTLLAFMLVFWAQITILMVDLVGDAWSAWRK